MSMTQKYTAERNEQISDRAKRKSIYSFHSFIMICSEGLLWFLKQDKNYKIEQIN